jgi:N-formylglutamate amidohydrolase
VELNRALYMDEAQCTRSRGFAALQSTLADFCRALVADTAGVLREERT